MPYNIQNHFGTKMPTKQFTIRTLLILFVPLSLALAADALATSKLRRLVERIEANPTSSLENEDTAWSDGGIAIWHKVSKMSETTSFYDRILFRRSISLENERTILLSKESANTSSFESKINVGLFVNQKIDSTCSSEGFRYSTDGFDEPPEGAFVRDESELTPAEKASQPSIQWGYQ